LKVYGILIGTVAWEIPAADTQSCMNEMHSAQVQKHGIKTGVIQIKR
jgi:hypothetical protein